MAKPVSKRLSLSCGSFCTPSSPCSDPINRTMAPGCVPSSLQTNLSILAAEAKRERVLHTTPKEKKAVANEERIYNSHLGLLRSELCTLDTAQFTRLVVRPTSLCHHLSGNSPVNGMVRRLFLIGGLCMRGFGGGVCLGTDT